MAPRRVRHLTPGKGGTPPKTTSTLRTKSRRSSSTSASASFTAVPVIGNKTMSAGNQTVQLEAAPYIKGGRAMLPLRAIGGAFGGDIEWDAVDRKVTVKPAGVGSCCGSARVRVTWTGRGRLSTPPTRPSFPRFSPAGRSLPRGSSVRALGSTSAGTQMRVQ
ncbi:MAG: copper amine oxidase N-terminal domain-containing protein [Caldisericota bacterium]|nr:copper amine oxidase N-terminal domain-containing protein [Caldisericota bacterium]